MTNKELRKMLKNIEASESIDNISDIAKMMANVIINDKNITTDSKMRFLFLYYQHRKECNKKALLLLDPANNSTSSRLDKILSLLFEK